MGVLFNVYRSQEITEKISIIYPTDRFAFPCTFTKSARAGRRDRDARARERFQKIIGVSRDEARILPEASETYAAESR